MLLNNPERFLRTFRVPSPPIRPALPLFPVFQSALHPDAACWWWWCRAGRCWLLMSERVFVFAKITTTSFVMWSFYNCGTWNNLHFPSVLSSAFKQMHIVLCENEDVHRYTFIIIWVPPRVCSFPDVKVVFSIVPFTYKQLDTIKPTHWHK